jgi:hypothetical protein
MCKSELQDSMAPRGDLRWLMGDPRWLTSGDRSQSSMGRWLQALLRPPLGARPVTAPQPWRPGLGRACSGVAAPQGGRVSPRAEPRIPRRLVGAHRARTRCPRTVRRLRGSPRSARRCRRHYCAYSTRMPLFSGSYIDMSGVLSFLDTPPWGQLFPVGFSELSQLDMSDRG